MVVVVDEVEVDEVVATSEVAEAAVVVVSEVSNVYFLSTLFSFSMILLKL